MKGLIETPTSRHVLISTGSLTSNTGKWDAFIRAGALNRTNTVMSKLSRNVRKVSESPRTSRELVRIAKIFKSNQILLLFLGYTFFHITTDAVLQAKGHRGL